MNEKYALYEKILFETSSLVSHTIRSIYISIVLYGIYLFCFATK